MCGRLAAELGLELVGRSDTCRSERDADYKYILGLHSSRDITQAAMAMTSMHSYSQQNLCNLERFDVEESCGSNKHHYLSAKDFATR